MNKMPLGLTALALAFVASHAFAQCTATSTINAANETTPVTGTTCQAVASLVQACQNQTIYDGSGVAIFALTVGTNNANISITATPTGTNTASFFPDLAVMVPAGTGCNASTACTNGNLDVQSPSAAAVNSTIPTGSAAGTYFIVIGDTDGVAPDNGCGPFSLAVTGTLPVQLQKFSVE
jgi:hypothetical protein